MKRIILLLTILLIPLTANATVQVKAITGQPVQVCTPSDPNSNCGGGGGINWPIAGPLTATTVNWENLTIISPSINADQVFNVKGYGAKGDGIHHTDGTISASSSSFTSASASFTAGDVGKVIMIFGAGTSGADLTTTISAYTSATAVTLTASAGTMVSGVDYTYGTDDTTAIQNTINAAGTAGGGTIFSPKGIYVINGSFGSTPPSQLYLPNVLQSVPTQSFNILGELERSTPFLPAPTYSQGSIWLFTQSGTSSQSGLGVYGGVTFLGSNFSNINVKINKMIFRMQSNPTSSAVDLTQAEQASGDFVVFEKDYTPISWSGFVQPTGTGNYALKPPGIYNAGASNWTNIYIANYYTGMLVPEHTMINGITIRGSVYGLEFPASFHTRLVEYADIEGVEWPLNFTGYNGPVQVNNLDLENFPIGGSWNATQSIINDPNNYGFGNVNYSFYDDNGPVTILNGGANLTTTNVATGATVFAQTTQGTPAGFSGQIGSNIGVGAAPSNLQQFLVSTPLITNNIAQLNNPFVSGSVGNNAGTVYTSGQTFQIPTAGYMQSINIDFGGSHNTPAGQVLVEIETDNAGQPSGTFVNYYSQQVITPNASNINTVTFPYPFALSANTQYWVVISPVLTQATNSYWTLAVATGTPYANGSFYTSSNGGSYTIQSGTSMYFQIYYGITNPQSNPSFWVDLLNGGVHLGNGINWSDFGDLGSQPVNWYDLSLLIKTINGVNPSSWLTGNQTITASGDATGSGTTSIPLTLATVNASPGTYTSANITVNGKGLITSASNGSGGGGSQTPWTSNIDGGGYALTDANINWSEIGNLLSTSGINWNFNVFKNIGINWTGLVDIGKQNANWYDITLISQNVWYGTEAFSSSSSSASFTPTGNYKYCKLTDTGTTGTITIVNPTNAYVDGQSLVLRINTSAVQTFSWGNAFNGGTFGLPTSTLGTTTWQTYALIYNTTTSHWEYTGNAGGFS